VSIMMTDFEGVDEREGREIVVVFMILDLTFRVCRR
jgi:hypothetical protein